MSFKKDNMTAGQRDIMEGAITNVPSKLLYSTDEKKTWKLLGDITLMHKNNNAYVYCMYGLKYDAKYYNAQNNKYFYPIPWSYIEPLWQGDDTEMVVIVNTSVFPASGGHGPGEVRRLHRLSLPRRLCQGL